MKKPAISGLAALALLWLLITPASAEVIDPAINVGTYYLSPDTQTPIPIMVSTSVLDPVMVRGLNFYVQLGDGGPVNSNAEHEGHDFLPTITSVDIIGLGTVFHGGSVTPPESLPATGGTYLIWQAQTVLGESEPARAAQGTLAFVTIDTTGMSAGETRTLTLKNVAQYVDPDLPDGWSTDFAGVPTMIIAGAIVIVPEPSTLLLLAAGLLATLLLRRRGPTGD